MMVSNKAVAAALLLTATAIASARADEAPSDTACKAFADAIDDAEKDASSMSVKIVVENSASRVVYLAGELNGDLATIPSNIALMAAHHCAPYAYPITDSAYLKAAVICERRIALAAAGGGGLPAECDRSKWERGSK